MIKGGYTFFDISSVTIGSQTPTVIPGAYQKIKDTYGKPVILKWSPSDEDVWSWGFTGVNDDGYVIAFFFINAESAIPGIVIITPDDGVICDTIG